MSMRVNTNVTAMNALLNLQRVGESVSTSIERLSSGLRINRAADDPAGLIISEGLRAQIDGLNQSIANAQDASNLLKTAEGGLIEINSLLRSIRSLAVHAANTGVNDATAVQANQTQIRSALQSIDRIATQTQFGTKKLLDGTAGASAVVTDTSQIAGIYIGSQFGASPISSGAVTATVTTQAARASFVGSRLIAGPNSVMGTFSGTIVLNGQTVQVNSTDTAQQVIDRINARSSMTNVSANWSGTETSGVVVFTQQNYGEGNRIRYSESTGIFAGSGAAVTSVDEAGISAVVTVQANTVDVRTGSTAVQSVTFTGSRAEGGNGLRVMDSVGNSLLLTESGNVSLSTGAAVATVSSSVMQFQIGSFASQYVAMSLGNAQANALGGTAVAGSFLKDVDVTTAAGASNAIRVVDEAIQQVSVMRAQIGAFQKNTLESTIRYLGVGVENLSASESQIRDTDVAAEVVAMTKNQILQSAGNQVLSQANMAPQQVLALLR
ncbi:MAG TPA: flagellin [Chthonomonadales bacterium]|nr:flagellin [Chthonomonadales bacterium]